MEVAAEGLHHLLGLVRAHEAVIDEHARELIAHGLVDEQRRDRRVHPARQAADDPLRADLRPDPPHLLLDHGGGSPGRRRTGDLVEEVLQDLLPRRGVHDLGVELDGVEASALVLEGGDRRRGRCGGDTRARRRGRDRIAMAHPHDLPGGKVVEERGLAELGVRLPVFRDVVRLDVAAEVAGHQLHPVADPERRDAQLEHRRIELRRPLGVHRGRAAREDQGARVVGPDLGRRETVADELRVHARLANPPGDQLAVLATEVEHQHGTVLGHRRRGGERDDLGLLSHAGSSEPPC